MNISDIRGVFPPLITPIDGNEKTDEKGLRSIINHSIESGLHGIYITGSCGESVSLTLEQRERAIKIAIDEVKGRVPVLCGIIDTSTRRVIESLKAFEQLSGEVAVITPPFYIKNSCQDEIIRHYETIVNSTSIKIMLYNIPDNTQVNILPETVEKLSKIDSIIGLKDSSGSWPQFQKCLSYFKDTDFVLFQGLPEFAVASIMFGASGITPVYSVLLPKIYCSLYESAVRKDLEKAFELQKVVSEINNINKLAASPISIQKYAISILGLTGKTATTPCEPLKSDEENNIKIFLDKYLDIEKSFN